MLKTVFENVRFQNLFRIKTKQFQRQCLVLLRHKMLAACIHKTTKSDASLPTQHSKIKINIITSQLTEGIKLLPNLEKFEPYRY